MPHLIFLCAAFAAAGSALGQEGKALRIVVPAAAGTLQDLLVRATSAPLAKGLGQPVIVDNRVGADGIIGLDHCAKAAADGQTLCNTMSGGLVWNPVLRSDLPYDAGRDFAAVVMAGFFDSAMVASANAPGGSLKELLASSKSKPDSVNWASFGVNSTGYMYMQWLNRASGAGFYHVPYKTPPQAVQALAAGEAHVAVIGLSTAAPLLKAGKVRALAVSSAARQPWLPDVPTFEELNVKLPLRTWFGYHFQAKTPGETIARMNAGMRQAMADPEVRGTLEGRLMVALSPGTPEEFRGYVQTQRSQVAELVKFLGLKPK